MSLYVDSDFGSSPDMKSTSGFIIALEGPDSFAIILWGSKSRGLSLDQRQRLVVLSTSLFGEAISLLAVCQRVFDAAFVLICYEDNQAVLAFIAKG